MLVLAGLCVFVSACCSPGVKPEDANIFQASCGIASGDFDKQLEGDKKQADSSRQALEEEKSKSQTLETDLVARKAEHGRLLTELDAMEKENRQIAEQIGKMQVNTVQAKQQQADQQAELVRIQGRLEALKQKASVGQDALHEYRSEASRLQQEIEVLRMIISAQ